MVKAVSTNGGWSVVVLVLDCCNVGSDSIRSGSGRCASGVSCRGIINNCECILGIKQLPE